MFFTPPLKKLTTTRKTFHQMQKYLANVDQNVYKLPLETKKGLAEKPANP